MQLRPETIEKYAMLARDKLIKLGRIRRTITYNELMSEIGGPGRGYIKQVLREICQDEDRHGRPLLGALVVRKHGGLPGNRFWQSPVAPEPIRSGSRQQQIDFWSKERSKVYEYWGKHKS